MRNVLLVMAGLLIVNPVLAHDVVWWEDPDASAPGNAMDFYYPWEYQDFIGVVPSSDEPCTVVVNLDAPTSTLFSAQVLPPNPANEVDILVTILRKPNGFSETANVTGEWHATGSPANKGCTAITPNRFSVPIIVYAPPPLWRLGTLAGGQSISIDAGIDCALQSAPSLLGPWLNIGKGQKFTIPVEMPFMFFDRFRKVGGFVSGTVTDSSGTPTPGTTLGLLYGGPMATTDSLGTFSLPRMPWGMNVLAITNPIGASLNVVVPATNNIAVGFKVAMAAQPAPATNACNCTPWCAIGFGTLSSGGQTPVYYAGGANPSGAANCGQATVTVTPPNGASYAIAAGSNRHQNSGANPTSGTWTVTTTVCGQTKSATVAVP